MNGIEKFGSINPIIVGKHGGKNNLNKLLASLDRSKLLTKKIEKWSPRRPQDDKKATKVIPGGPKRRPRRPKEPPR